MSSESPSYDLLLWGATGVTGRLVAAEVTRTFEEDTCSLAIAGRNKSKLAALERDLVAHRDGWSSIPIEVGDATDQASVQRLVDRTGVVCSTVGPYTRYGTPMVAACVDTGTDYCDLSGEVTWIREMIDRFHPTARENGARIVHCCGFDSMPADLGTLLVQTRAQERFGSPCSIVSIALEGARGGVSGGTLDSMVEMFRAAERDSLARATLENPYSLAPAGERDGIDRGVRSVPQRDPFERRWLAPSPLGLVNERVIRRSNALLGYPWGREFTCAEFVPTGSGVGGLLASCGVTLGTHVGMSAMRIGPLREALHRFVFPDPGEGPGEASIEDGYFRLRVRGQGVTQLGRFVVESTIAADTDPGYGATGKMLSAATACLVREETATPLTGGILTPASGIGLPLVDAVRAAGLSVSSRLVSGPGQTADETGDR